MRLRGMRGLHLLGCRDQAVDEMDQRNMSMCIHFAADSALECLSALEENGAEWELQTAKLIRRSCPLSVACAFEMIRRVRQLDSVEEALAMEFRFTSRSMSHGEFIEGVRAQIIDKDRQPKWATPRLEDVTREQIDAMLAPLGETELNLEGVA